MTSIRYSRLYEQALRVATTTHRHQNRKGCEIPYITHPVYVSVILLRYGFPVEIAVAGLLHDVVEDQGYPLSKIEDLFGTQVSEMVGALSEDKVDAAGNKRKWEIRKQGTLQRLREASLEAVAVKAADTLHNARSIMLDVQQEGPKIWLQFTRGLEPLLHHYRQVLWLVQERLRGHPLTEELTDVVEDLARLVNQTGVIHFIRHGNVGNPNKIFYGRLPGFHLDQEGRQQAQIAGEALRDRPIAAIFSSPLERAQETAAIISTSHNGVTVETNDLLNEVLSPFDGWPMEKVRKRGFDVYTGTEPPFEQLVDVLNRGQRFVVQIHQKYAGREVVAITHGDVIAMLILWAQRKPIAPEEKQKLYRRHLAPGSITTFAYQMNTKDKTLTFQCLDLA